MDLHDGIALQDSKIKDNNVKADGESPKVSDKKINLIFNRMHHLGNMQLRRTTKLKRQEFGQRI